MIIWLYLLSSDKDYHKIIDFLKNFDEVYGVSYFVVDGALKLKNGTYFGDLGSTNILLSFSTHFLYFKTKDEAIDLMHPSVDFYLLKIAIIFVLILLLGLVISIIVR